MSKYVLSRQFIALITLFSVFSNSALAATWYVDDSQSHDPDTCVADEAVNDDNCTFRDALSQAGNGDTINFLEHIFMEIEVDTDIFQITQDDLTVDGEGFNVNFDAGSFADSSDDIFFDIAASGVTLKDLYLMDHAAGTGINVQNGEVGTLIDNVTIGYNSSDFAQTGALIGINDNGDETVIQNSVISSSSIGIYVGSGATDTLIDNNKIGPHPGGDFVDNGNSGHGIYVDAGAGMNGGNGGQEGLTISNNLISGNQGNAIQIADAGVVGDVVIEGNRIGTNLDGDTAIANAQSALFKAGVYVNSGFSADPDDFDNLSLSFIDNLISGNDGYGVQLSGDKIGSLLMTGNIIGMNLAKNAALANSYDGININLPNITDVTIGGALEADRNFIGGNGDSGLNVTNASSTEGSLFSVLNNYFGIGGDGITAIGNTDDGMTLFGGGYQFDVEGNVVSNSGQYGIVFNTGVVLNALSNKIGTFADGTGDASNVGDGMRISSATLATALIGDTDLGNIFANSNGSGLFILSGVPNDAEIAVKGNYFGTNSTSDALGNAANGLDARGGVVTVGGDRGEGGALGEGNTFAENGEAGISLGDGLDAAYIYGNMIGTVDEGSTGNAGSGIRIVSDSVLDVVIGGAGAKRNIISGNGGDGILTGEMADGAAVEIKNNFIGTDALGVEAFGNAEAGIQMTGMGNSVTVDIGGALEGEGNLISGNLNEATFGGDSGIRLTGLTGTTNICGNTIGLTADRLAALGNVGYGIHLADSVGTEFGLGSIVNIGCEGEFGGNYLAGNGTGNYTAQVYARVDESPLAGLVVNMINNIVGLAEDGTVITHAADGVQTGNVTGGEFNIGNGTLAGRNVISGNGYSAINVSGDADTAVNIDYNYIGTSADGTAARGNGYSEPGEEGAGINGGGIMASGSGLLTILNNVISSNYGFGVMMLGHDGAEIADNIIGLNAAGTAVLGNQLGDDTPPSFNGTGLLILDTMAGDTDGTKVEGNVIAGNDGAGLMIVQDDGSFGGAAGIGQDWTGGYIRSNILGFLADGVTAANNGSFNLYMNDEAGLVTNLAIGGDGVENTINATDRVGVHIAAGTPSNLATLGADNDFNTACPVAHNWVSQYVADVLSIQLPDCSEPEPEPEEEEQGGGGGGGAVIVNGGNNNNEDNSSEEEEESVVEEESPVRLPAQEVEEDREVRGEEGDDSEDAEEAQEAEREEAAEDSRANTSVTDIDEDEFDAAVEAAENGEDKVGDFTEEEDFERSEEGEYVRSIFEYVAGGGGNVNNEMLIQLEKIVDTKVKDAIKKRGGSRNNKGGFLVKNGSKTQLMLENSKIVVSLDSDPETLERLRADGSIVITPSTIDAENNMSLLYMMENDIPFDDGDDVPAAKEVFLGMNPRVADEFTVPSKPIVTNVDGRIWGSQPLFWVVGPDDYEVDVVLVDKEDEEKQYYIGSDVLVDNMAAIVAEEELPDGEYYVFTKARGDGYTVVEMTIDKEKALEMSDLLMSGGVKVEMPLPPGYKNGMPEPKGGKVTFYRPADYGKSSLLDVMLATNSTKDLEFETVEGDDGKMVVKGFATPGTVVYFTWKSVILNSVVISDASQGYFELEVPEDLEDGDHKAIAYAYDREQSLVSKISQILFEK